jgi:hypothetical protein
MCMLFVLGHIYKAVTTVPCSTEVPFYVFPCLSFFCNQVYYSESEVLKLGVLVLFLSVLMN